MKYQVMNSMTAGILFQGIVPDSSGLRRIAAMLFARFSTKTGSRIVQARVEEYECIMERYGGLIKKICYYYSSSAQEYEDFMQDASANIWRGLDSFRKESKQSTWIYRICLNTCISGWRRNSRHNNLQTLDSIVEPGMNDGNDKEEVEALHYLISLLAPEEKALIMLWLDEKSYEEISDVTGYNRNTVATKLRRIKDKLAKKARHL
ncbi:MAG: sigma-70 family RNA polymerase sigma factor [Muribaculaceae bacterium]|nr:sigma-70 family RNA polymerase sigma factor [Muribaculaceae bacterium]